MSETRVTFHPAKTDPELLALLEQVKHLPPMTLPQIAAQRKSWIVGEMMLEHPEMLREDAEAIYDTVWKQG